MKIRLGLGWVMPSVLVTLLVGCAAPFVQHTKLNRPPHKLSPKVPQQVEVFARKSPNAPYTEVYLLQVEEDSMREPGEVLGEMRKRAGQLGCDAIILAASTTSIQSWGATHITSSTDLRGVCIVYNGETPR